MAPKQVFTGAGIKAPPPYLYPFQKLLWVKKYDHKKLKED